MRLLLLARKPPQWLRVALAGLMLAFALNSIAHVTHRHEATTTSATHSLACGYCISFDGIVDAPRHNHVPPAAAHVGIQIAPAPVAWVASRPSTSARPRAPPFR